MNEPEQVHADSASAASIEQAAVEWLSRRRDGLTADDEGCLAAWLEADRRHRLIFAELEQVWDRLNEPRVRGQADELALALDRLARRRRRSRQFVGIGLAAAAAIAIGMFTITPQPADRPVPAATMASRPDRVALPDGSIIELNSGGRVEVAFTRDRRTVRLESGEALFQVTKDPARPFVVVAGALEVVAVGTAFSVSRGASEVGVLVTEGTVAVGAPTPSPGTADRPILLTVGDKLVMDSRPDGPAVLAQATLPPAEVKAALAWREMRVEFSGTPLAEAVALFNRRNALQLVVADPSIVGLQLTGIFWVDDPEGFVRLLHEGMGIRAESGPGRIVLRKR